jgi:hypothetical protein
VKKPAGKAARAGEPAVLAGAGPDPKGRDLARSPEPVQKKGVEIESARYDGIIRMQEGAPRLIG